MFVPNALAMILMLLLLTVWDSWLEIVDLRLGELVASRHRWCNVVNIVLAQVGNARVNVCT